MLNASKFTPHLSGVSKRLIDEHFSADQFHVSDGDGDGGGEVAVAFAQLPFDHLLFTGSTRVGQIVAKAAPENLTPVTLELGGKSPVVVDQDYSIDRAARNVAWAKLYNAGQVCAAPDYVLVPRGTERAFAQAVLSHARQTYPNMGDSASYTALLNQAHSDRVESLVDECRSRSAEVLIAEDPETGHASRKVPADRRSRPADRYCGGGRNLRAGLASARLRHRHAAIDLMSSRGTPLAFYVLSRDSRRQRFWLNNVAMAALS